ncbi:hypothetical protein SK128_006310, partial [Halocaridina rubra]
MATSEEDHVPVRDGRNQHPKYTQPEEMYWLREMNQEELRDKYVKLKDDFLIIKKFSCRQEDKIKKLQTKIRKLIADRKKEGKNISSAAMRIQEIEHREVVEGQQHSIRELKFKNEQLEKKLKLANVQLSTARKNKPLMYRNVGPRVDSGLKQTKSMCSLPTKYTRPKSSPPKMSVSEESSCILSPELLQEDQMVPARVREILEEARERILALEAERNDLQEHISELQQSAEDTEYEWQQKYSVLEDEVGSLRLDLRERGVREERDSVAIIRSQREIHTLTARSTALQEQLVLTEDKVDAEKAKANTLQAELDRVFGKMHGSEAEAKGYQQELQRVKGQLQQLNEKYSVLEREGEQLQRENERLVQLSLASDQRVQTAEVESLKSQIVSLEAALQNDLGERGQFLEHMTRDKEELARCEAEMKELRSTNLELQEELEKVKQKLDIYAKAGLLDLTQKELEVASIKNEETCANEANLKELENLKQSYSELQLLYREKKLELEKTAQTLSSHASTYKNLQLEIERVREESRNKEHALSKTIQGFQDAIKLREERSEKLERQILLLTDKNLKNKIEGISHDYAQNVKLTKYDNVLEFHIESITYDSNDFNQLKTFVSWTVPFALEDPLQHTNVAIGKFASFNYSSLYKFQMNYRNLESLREDIVTASIYNLLESGHPAKIGECHVSYAEVLEHPRNVLHGTLPVIAAYDDVEELQHLPQQIRLQVGQEIGSLSFWFRLLRPCKDIITQHIRNISAVSALQHLAEDIPAWNPVSERRLLQSSQETYSPSRAVNKPTELSTELRQNEAFIVSTPKSLTPECKPLKVDSTCIGGETSVYKAVQGDEETALVATEAQAFDKANVEQEAQERNHESQESSSPSSVGTYSVKSPTHNIQRLDSPLSTGTYNIESPSKNIGDNPIISSNGSIYEKSNTEIITQKYPEPVKRTVTRKKISRVKSAAAVKPLSSDIEDSKHSRRFRVSSVKTVSSNIAEDKQSRRSRESLGKPLSSNIEEDGHSRRSRESLGKTLNSSIAEDKYSRRSRESLRKTLSRNTAEDKFSRNSKESSASSRNPKLKHEALSSEESLSSDQEGSATMFEETHSSSGTSDRSSRENDYKNSHPGRLAKNTYERVQSRQRKQHSSSRSSTRSHETEPSTMPSHTSVISDSDGVVAVVPKTVTVKDSKVYIEICSLTLSDSAVTMDPLVEFIFVDYHGFLGLPPELLETPQSFPKPPPGCTLNFNFGQEFSVDEKLYPTRRHALEELMKNRGLLKFTITSEPPEELQDSHDCQDLGYAFVNLHDILKKGHDLQEKNLIVENVEDGSEMGTLCITLHILN